MGRRKRQPSRDKDQILRETAVQVVELSEKAAGLCTNLEQFTPYIRLGMAVAAKCDAIGLADFAALARINGIHMTHDTMLRWLCNADYFLRVEDMPTPRVAHIHSGLFRVEDGTLETISGQMLTLTPLVTGKGQVVLLDALRREFGEDTIEEETYNG